MRQTWPGIETFFVSARMSRGRPARQLWPLSMKTVSERNALIDGDFVQHAVGTMRFAVDSAGQHSRLSVSGKCGH